VVVLGVVVGVVVTRPLGGQAMSGAVTGAGTGVGLAVEGGRIVVSAVGEVVVVPDRARIQLGVETQARTAALAAQENARKQSAVLRAMAAAGVKPGQVSTVGYGVSPVQRWDDKLQRTVIDGYQVHNIVAVETAVLEQVAAILDGALGAGANRVVGLTYGVQDAGAAEDRALALAVERARRQAEVVAKASGGVVTGMVEVQVGGEEGGDRPPVMARMAMASAEGVPTPVSEGTQTVRVRVVTRWGFAVGGGR
jgi:uncharacterized protein YggE